MPTATITRKKIAPPGTIKAHSFDSIPDGYLLCDGCIVNVADYPKLFDAIGTSWGYGNNDGLTFHLPDLRGRFIRGTDLGAGVDPEAGTRTPNNDGGNSMDNVGTDQNDKTRSSRDTNMVSNLTGGHRHAFRVDIGNSGNAPDRSLEPDAPGAHDIPDQAQGNHNHTITGGGDLETRPINSSVVYVIKT